MGELRSQFTPSPPVRESANGHSPPADEFAHGTGGGSHATDWETTRYLAAATQLDLPYARLVTRRIIGEPFRAVAPAAGADVVVVTRWALAALRRRAQRDVILVALLVLGTTVAIVAWEWVPIPVMIALAAISVAVERWTRDENVIARRMLRGRFHASDAPLAPSPRIEERLAVVKEQQNGNLVVFRGHSPFVGSGQKVRHSRIVASVALGKRGKNGKRQQPIPFTNPELQAALESALRNMGFPDLRVSERLFVNGQHVADDPRLLPDLLAPPAASAHPSLLRHGCIHPTPDARTYLCAEIGGWKGQLVVSLFARVIQAHGSLQVEWKFQVLPPLHEIFLGIDHRYQQSRAGQLAKAGLAGLIGAVPALIVSPVQVWRYAVVPLQDKSRKNKQSYAIRNGYVFDYGSLSSIREDAIGAGTGRLHYFLAQDELTFILLAEHTLYRALGRFLEEHKIDLEQFEEQQKTFIKNVSKYNIDKVSGANIAVGNKSKAGRDSKD